MYIQLVETTRKPAFPDYAIHVSIHVADGEAVRASLSIYKDVYYLFI